MTPIKKGMTEAVTRDGRRVTQLTWFEGVESKYCVGGVLDGGFQRWSHNGYYCLGGGYPCNTDIFATIEAHEVSYD